MREKLVGLLAAALMCVCGVASANITYTVVLSGNGETVTGTITTDGASGQLSAANVLSWSLSGSGDLTFSFDKSLPSSSVACGVGCGLDANGSELEFVGSDTGYADYFELAHGGVAAEF